MTYDDVNCRLERGRTGIPAAAVIEPGETRIGGEPDHVAEKGNDDTENRADQIRRNEYLFKEGRGARVFSSSRKYIPRTPLHEGGCRTTPKPFNVEMTVLGVWGRYWGRHTQYKTA